MTATESTALVQKRRHWRKCDEYAAKGQVKKMWLVGIGIPLVVFNVIRAIPTFLIVYYGSQYSSVVEGLMPDWLNNAMGVVGGMLPAVGMALLLKVMLKKKSHWCFFLIGFLAYSVFGISAVTLTILVYQGIAIGREKQIGFILAVGGGSVIDTAKAIAVGIPYSGDVWNVLQRYETATRSLPIGTVLTAVGSGSEMSNSCVITKMPEGLKRSFDSEINIPKFSILDPHYTFSVSPRQTACGSADILSHLMERYFTQVKQADVTDRMLEGLMQTVILYAPRAMEHPEDYDARAELMWAGTLAQNGLLNTGRIGDWACHGIEHEISGEYDIPHGMGLAMITGSWMRYVYSSYPARFTQFARRVFHVDYPDYDEEHIIQEGIYRLEQFFIRLGLPVSTAQLNMSHEVMERLAEQAVYKSPTKGRFRKLTKEDLVKILEMAQGNS